MSLTTSLSELTIALIMLKLLMFVLVAFTQAENRKCYEFCKLLSSGQADVLWQNGCNCFSEKQHGSEAFKPWSKIGPVVRLDDSGIYYEPAEIYPSSQLSFVDQPFYILNPAMKINIKSSTASKENQSSKKRTAKFTSIPYNNQHLIDTKSNQRKESISDPIIHSEIPDTPTYLDVGLKKSANPWRNAPDGKVTEASPLTEKVLINCVDLYIFVHARKTATYPKLQEIWGEKKFQQYYALTGSQLKREIQEKCSLPADIVEQSRKEIIGKWPKKNINKLKSMENLFSKLQDDSEAFENSVIKYKVESESATIVSETFDENAATTISDYTTERSIHYLIQNEESQPDESEHTTTPHTTPDNYDRNKFLVKNTNDDEKIIKSTQSTIATEQTNYLNEQDDIKTTYNYFSDRDMETQSDFPVKKSDLNSRQSTVAPTTLRVTNFTAGYVDKDEMEIHSTEITEALPTDNTADDLKFTNPYSKTTLLNENKFDNITKKPLPNVLEITNTYTENTPIYEDKVGLPRSTDSVLPTDYISPDNDLGATTMINDTDERQKLTENDKVLPKIITIEYSNDTVWSGINGTEQITNNNLQNDSVRSHINSDSVTTEKQASFINMSLVSNSSNDKVEKNVTSLTDVIGKLYFNYHQQNIPAHFIQNPNGEINISIDGISLCDKITSLDRKSRLISVICKCLQSNNCMSR